MSSTLGPRQPGSYASFPFHNPHNAQPMTNLRYTLQIGQQPVRARMCGFGDKDRRPITPPPCVRLRVYNDKGEEVTNITDVDCNFFILSADLWDEEGRQEQNLVMHPNTAAGGIGGTTLSSPSTSNFHHHPTHMPIDNHQYHHPSYPQHGGHLGYQHGYPPYPPSVPPMHHGYQPMDDYPPHSSQAGAFRLKDHTGTMGIWFILQDLSVRTEGKFKLKFSFFNLGLQPETGDHRRTGMLLNKGPTKVQATAMSDTFQVFSAKKFPGMIESTELSKAFAHQGIRIAVRHNTDANNANGGNANQNRRNTGSGSPLGKNSDGEDDADDDGDEE